MGAFVGNVTSPFLRRRKGRVGRDVIAPLIAPTYGGAVLHHAAGNYQATICAQTGAPDRTYQRGDFGQSAWVGELLPDLNTRIGNLATPGESQIKVRPFNDHMDIDAWHLQNHFSAAGIHVTIGGGLYQISPDGKINKENFQVAGAPIQGVAWSDDGRCYMTAGQPIAGTVQARGNFSDDTPDAPLSLGYIYPNSVGALGCNSLFAFRERTYRYRYAFLAYNTASVGADTIKPLYRRMREGDVVNGADLVSPLAVKACGNWMQIQDKLIAFDAATPNMISAFLIENSGAATANDFSAWSSVAVGTGSGIKGAWKYGKRIYAISNVAPRIRMSRNYGVTWETNAAQPPDAGAALSAAFNNLITGDIFMLANDGAINRMYYFRPYLEI